MHAHAVAPCPRAVRRTPRRAALALTVLAAVLAAPASLAAQWAVTPLGFLNSGSSGHFSSFATAVNVHGQVVGESVDAFGRRQAFITGPDGAGMTGLGFLDGGTHEYSASVATGVNASGQVVGWSRDEQGRTQAFITGANGTGMSGVGFLDAGPAGTQQSFAYGVNDHGQVVGTSLDDQGLSQAFLTGANGAGITALTSSATGSALGLAVNNSGQVAGVSFGANGGRTEAFLTGANGAGVTGLGVLAPVGSATEAWAYSNSYALNAHGQVAGMSMDGIGRETAFVTGPDGGAMVGVGALTSGWPISYAHGINASAQVVGWYRDDWSTPSIQQAFISGPGGVGMYDLGSLLSANGLFGWNITRADAISDNGYIAAVGSNASLGIERQALLIRTPDLSPVVVSEPSSLGLAALGVFAFGLVALQRRRQRRGLRS